MKAVTKRLVVGDRIEELTLPGIDGKVFDLGTVKGKRFMLSFLRFAGCPFCNLRVHELSRESSDWPNTFTVVAVFDSPIADVMRHTEKHVAPFPILADEENRYYQKFAVERSWGKTLSGAAVRIPRVLYALFVRGFWPTTIKGKMNTMPLDVLVDEEGVVREVRYGKDEGDHIPLEAVTRFAKGG